VSEVVNELIVYVVNVALTIAAPSLNHRYESVPVSGETAVAVNVMD
jgi:hypothetical protein